MRHLFLLLILLCGLSSFNGQAQGTSSAKKPKHYTQGFLSRIELDGSFGWNIQQNAPHRLRSVWFPSVNWEAQLAYRHYFYNNFFSLSAGIAFGGRRVRWRDNNLFIQSDREGNIVLGSVEALGITPAESEVSIFRTITVGIPVIFSIYPLRGRERSLGISMGVHTAYVLATRSRHPYVRNGGEHATSISREFYTNPLQVTLEGRISIGILYFYYRHNMLPFFQEGRGITDDFSIHGVGLGITSLP